MLTDDEHPDFEGLRFLWVHVKRLSRWNFGGEKQNGNAMSISDFVSKNREHIKDG